MTLTTISVEDMHCAACANKITQCLSSISDIGQLQFNPVKRQVFVTHNNGADMADILGRIERAGFNPRLQSDSRFDSTDDRILLKRLGVAGLAMMQVMMVQIGLYAGDFQGMDDSIRRLLELTALMFCIPVVCFSAVPFFSSAWRSLRQGLNMDTPIALAITIAFITSLVSTVRGVGEVYYDSVVMFTFLMLGARYLESRLRQQLTLEDSLFAALPKTTVRIVGERKESVELDDIRLGDHLWIGQGEQIPADAVLSAPMASIDESSMTGEAALKQYELGARLFAGTINSGAAIIVTVTKLPRDSRVAEIDRMANAAFEHKHKLALLADRVARVFIPCILMLATFTFLAWNIVDPSQALSAALAVLVVSCPCALALATPSAITAALARLRQAGVLVKQARALEVSQTISDVYFDKTGTLTEPDPFIEGVQCLGKWDEKTCRDLAAALQAHSSHPLARAFANSSLLPADGVQVEVGAGVSGWVRELWCQVGSADFCGFEASLDAPSKLVYFAVDRQPAAVFHLSNTIRADAHAAVFALRNLGLRVSMLSGDQQHNCQAIAQRLGIDFEAQASPEDKPSVMRSNQGGALFVGDGLNDLPALATADISAATFETADLVKSKADLILLSKKLMPLVDFVRVGRFSRRVMRQNLAWAFAYNMIAIPLAALGFVPPWGAALGMSLSSIIVMSNASRILIQPIGAQA